MSQSAESGPKSLPRSDIHDVLRNDRRRLVLERLRETGREAVSDLAEDIGAVESGEDPPPRNVRQSVYVSLHQTHLPKLNDLGIVVYDDDEKEVSLAENADEVLVFMEVDEGDADDDWVQQLVVLSAVAAVGGLVALIAGLVPMINLPALVGGLVALVGAAASGGLAFRQLNSG
jgi:predicted transcriptional regulator